MWKVTCHVWDQLNLSYSTCLKIMLMPVCLLTEDPEVKNILSLCFPLHSLHFHYSVHSWCFSFFHLSLNGSFFQWYRFERSQQQLIVLPNANPHGTQLQRESSSHKIITIQYRWSLSYHTRSCLWTLLFSVHHVLFCSHLHMEKTHKFTFLCFSSVSIYKTTDLRISLKSDNNW